jgi:2'-5' RNA ligase
MQRFNAVLMPAGDFKDKAVELAQDNYADIADGYCLSHKVYPHITLCRFEAEDMPMVFVDGLFYPKITEFAVCEGEGKHEGYLWVQYSIDKEDWLVALQNSVRDNLGEVKILSAQGDNYDPHMTFCRVPSRQKKAIKLLDILPNTKPWIFTIGHSDENGQFLG